MVTAQSIKMNTLVRFIIIMHSNFQTRLSLPLLHRGKVRDIFDIDKDIMLIVTTDRLSAFDVVFVNIKNIPHLSTMKKRER